MHWNVEKLALNLVRGAFMELYLTPKPGLVDLSDSGSHPELSVSKMETSLKIVSRYLLDLSGALSLGEDFAAQMRLGTAAEKAVLRTVGTTCHKGYIFLSGMLLSASTRARRPDEGSLRQAVASLAALFFSQRDAWQGSGSRARTRFQGGIRREALAGFPSLFDEALPVFRREIASGGNRGSAVFAMLGRLMQAVEDTTTLHRCGREGLRTLQEDGRNLERLVAERDDFIAFLAERNSHYVDRNLTMGGVAGLLALALAWLSHTGELEAVTPA